MTRALRPGAAPALAAVCLLARGHPQLPDDAFQTAERAPLR